MSALRMNFLLREWPLRNAYLDKRLPITEDLNEATLIEALRDMDLAIVTLDAAIALRLLEWATQKEPWVTELGQP